MVLRFRPDSVVGAILGTASLVGCMPPVPRYVEPPPEAPHAMVLVSTTLASQPGEYVDHTIDVDGRQIPLASGALVQGTSAIRVAPGETRWAFASRFYHHETTSSLERVRKTAYEYDACARTNYKGRCESGLQAVTKYHLETVTRTEVVEDARCDASNGFALIPARTYRIAYTFVSKDNCNITCLDITEGAGVPCATPAAQSATAPSSVAVSKAPATQAREAPLPTSTTPALRPKADRPLEPFGTAALVLGCAGVATGAVAGVLALHRKDVVSEHCNPYGTCDAEGLVAAQEGKTAAAVSTTAFGVGGALVVGGIALLVFGPSKMARQPSVAVGRDGAQLGLGGTF